MSAAPTLAKPGSGSPGGPQGRVLRLGAVSYLNAEPTVHGLEQEPTFSVERDLPARVAERLHAGEVDLALVPSIEYAPGRTSSARSGRSRLMECEVALRSRSGAATMTSASGASASSAARMPPAMIPSSFDSRMSGRIELQCVCRGDWI